MKNKILVIDDDDLLREIIGSELSEIGYEVITAPDGTSGFELAKRHLPDLILSDINLPDKDGYEIVKLLRSNNVTSTIPTILMTGVMRDYKEVRKGMELGADDYIMKPFTIPDLVKAIESRLSRQKEIVKKAETKLGELRHNITISLPHEFRTPLTTLVGFSEILQSDYKEMDREEIGAIAQMMLKASQRLQKIIEEYLDFSQTELMLKDSTSVLKFKENIITNIDSVISSQANQIAGKLERVQDLNLDVQKASVQISEYHLKKIIKYLVENAFKFSKVGSLVQIRSFKANGFYQIIIKDHGCGMSQEQILSIDGYMQFDRQKQEQQGLGLGLIIAKRLIDAYNGAFIIESQINIGTTVIIKLLLKDQ